MPTTISISPTDDADVNAVLSGTAWATDTFTFSFPDSGSEYGKRYGDGEPTHHFQALTSVQQAAVESVLDMYASVANLTFNEIAETPTQHADLRFAESDKPGTAWAYYPSAAAYGGDVWFNRSTGLYDDPVPGNYAWLTMIHELGHAMGLKHPQEVIGFFGTMPAEYDSLEYTVMSYRSYVDAPRTAYTNNTTSFPQTLMMYDIAALQTLYGADYNTNSGNTVYQWDPNSGQMFVNGVGQGAPAGNKVFMTLWDGGGHDTYDFSNYTSGVDIDLQPGQWSTTSTAQLAVLGPGHLAAGNIANALLYHGNPASLIEDAIGGSGNDTIVGNAADNTLTGGAGNDVLDGGAGVDAAAYSGPSLDYSWFQAADGSWTVVDNRAGSPDGTDTLRNIQYLDFSDTQVQLDDVDSVTPTDPNTGPVAVNDSFVAHQRSVTINVLANDVAPDAAALSAIVIKAPARGKLSVDDNGNFVYTAPKHFKGTVKFTYIATDGSTDSALATARIKVGAPVAAQAFGHGNDATGRDGGKGHQTGHDRTSIAEDQIAPPAGFALDHHAKAAHATEQVHLPDGQSYGTDLGHLYEQHIMDGYHYLGLDLFAVH